MPAGHSEEITGPTAGDRPGKNFNTGKAALVYSAIAVRRLTPLRKMLNLVIVTRIVVLIIVPAPVAVGTFPLVIERIPTIGLVFPALLGISGFHEYLLGCPKRGGCACLLKIELNRLIGSIGLHCHNARFRDSRQRQLRLGPEEFPQMLVNSDAKLSLNALMQDRSGSVG